ncbi:MULTISPECIES: hypothetical protein [Neobacillus]|uniref:Uncharacterized protein n=1 Tax=Neobacillus rhizophilus TaxID=2833579 RepID=A0A942U5L4_9BACI|nr:MULTISPECIES: hypothetical protein [Neobacillus]MBS4215155.1 hypothetical protein [Neobacillus rhizophilus]
MKNWAIFILIIFALTGCRSTPFDGHAVIDWVDFLKWDGIEYDGIYSGVLADEEYLGDKIGTVKFKVADNVTNPNYKIRNGDAAFHEKGTEIYAIKGVPQFIAVKSPRDIHGYRVYYSRKDFDYKWHFKDMPMEKVNRIEIYLAYQPEGPKKLVNIDNPEEIKKFLQVLNEGESSPNFQPNMDKGDPTVYDMVFYTDQPIAYKYDLLFDGITYYWHPWDTAILSNGIGDFLPKQ